MKTLIKILCLSVLWFSCEDSCEDEENALIGTWKIIGTYDFFSEHFDLVQINFEYTLIMSGDDPSFEWESKATIDMDIDGDGISEHCPGSCNLTGFYISGQGGDIGSIEFGDDMSVDEDYYNYGDECSGGEPDDEEHSDVTYLHEYLRCPYPWIGQSAIYQILDDGNTLVLDFDNYAPFTFTREIVIN